MIIYIFNGYFPEASGFGRRCLREIEALSTLEDIVVVCRRKSKEAIEEIYSEKEHTIKIARYLAKSEVVHKPDNYQGNGWYEIKRNLDIMISLTKTLVRLIHQNKKKDLKLYCVTSPLTVPLLVLLLAKLLRVEPTLVSFHDLEPELAMHLKKIPAHHWIVKIELFLEWLVCKGYKKILVTSEGQVDRLIQRNKLNKAKILAVPNTTDITSLIQIKEKAPLRLSSRDFLIVYMSTLSFGYTTDGFITFMSEFKKIATSLPTVKIAVIGGGEGLSLITSFVREHKLEKQVFCLGFMENPTSILKQADAAIIPWEKDEMTETMLPTKLFEYLSLGIPVIAPAFGEFSRILKNRETALLYRSIENALNSVQLLLQDKALAEVISTNGNMLYNTTYLPEILNKKLLSFVQHS